MDGESRKVVAVLDSECVNTLELAAFYARALESLAQRMQSVAIGGKPADTVALRSAALRLSHAANEGLAALLSVVVQSARLDVLATIRTTLEDNGRGDLV